MLAVSTSFATEPPVVDVEWVIDECSCGSVFVDFKVTLSIYDNANSTWTVQNKIRYTGSGTVTDLEIDVPEMLDYCHDTHDYTPAFTVTATVWGILVGDAECCTGSGSNTGDCHDFEADDIHTLDVGYLN